MKRLFTGIITLGMVAALFAGCGNQDVGKNEQTESPQNDIPATIAPVERVDFDPFTDFKIEFDGASPFLEIGSSYQVTNPVNGHIILDFADGEPDYFKNGDTIHVRFDFPQDYADQNGYNVVNQELDFSIDGWPEYMQDYDQMPESVKTDLINRALEKVAPQAMRGVYFLDEELGSSTYTPVSENVVLDSVRMYTRQENGKASHANIIFMIFKSEEEALSSDGNDPQNIYHLVIASNVMASDGTIVTDPNVNYLDSYVAKDENSMNERITEIVQDMDLYDFKEFKVS